MFPLTQESRPDQFDRSGFFVHVLLLAAGAAGNATGFGACCAAAIDSLRGRCSADDQGGQQRQQVDVLAHENHRLRFKIRACSSPQRVERDRKSKASHAERKDRKAPRERECLNADEESCRDRPRKRRLVVRHSNGHSEPRMRAARMPPMV